MCVALAVAASGARCSGQVVCVVPGRRGFGRKLAHGSAIAGERWRGSQFGEPDGCVWWVGSVLRRATDPVRGVPPQARTARRCTSSRYHRRLLPGSVPKGPSSCHRAVLAWFCGTTHTTTWRYGVNISACGCAYTTPSTVLTTVQSSGSPRAWAPAFDLSVCLSAADSGLSAPTRPARPVAHRTSPRCSPHCRP